MVDFLGEHYLWVRAFHLISIIAWMAGLLYLPRLFVYHCDAKKGSELSETLKTMEHRLLRYIMNPAMAMAWIFGGLMLYISPHLMENGWMHVKLTGVIIITVFHHALGYWRKDFLKDENKHSSKFYRVMNEVPTLCMIVIVIMAIVNPF